MASLIWTSVNCLSLQRLEQNVPWTEIIRGSSKTVGQEQQCECGWARTAIRRWLGKNSNTKVVRQEKQCEDGWGKTAIRRWLGKSSNTKVVGQEQQYEGGWGKTAIRRWLGKNSNAKVVGQEQQYVFSMNWISQSISMSMQPDGISLVIQI